MRKCVNYSCKTFNNIPARINTVIYIFIFPGDRDRERLAARSGTALLQEQRAGGQQQQEDAPQAGQNKRGAGLTRTPRLRGQMEKNKHSLPLSESRKIHKDIEEQCWKSSCLVNKQLHGSSLSSHVKLLSAVATCSHSIAIRNIKFIWLHIVA